MNTLEQQTTDWLEEYKKLSPSGKITPERLDKIQMLIEDESNIDWVKEYKKVTRPKAPNLTELLFQIKQDLSKW